MNIRNLWIIFMRHIRKNLIIFTMLLAIITVAVFLVYTTFYEWNRENYNVYMTRKMLGGIPNLYNISLTTMDTGENTENAMEEFLSRLSEIEGVVSSGRQMTINVEWKELVDNKEFLNINEKLFSGTIRERYPTLIDIHCVDKGLLSIFGLSDLKGENTNETIPVMVGTAYRDFFNVGEVYTDSFTGCKYRIVGFLPMGKRLPSEMPLYSDLYINTDYGMVAVYDDKMNPDHMLTLNAGNSMYYVSDGLSEIRKDVYSLAKDCGLYIKISTIEEMISEYNEQNKESIAITFLFTGIAVLAGFISVVSATTIRILLNKQEYGILYANGVSIEDSIKVLILDNGMKILLAMVLAFFAAQWYIQKITVTDLAECLYMFYTKVVPETSVIVILLWLLSTGIPAYILNRMSIVELLRGNEL